MNDELRCKVCGKLAKDDAHFYKTKMLCNRHALQIAHHGKPLDTKCVANPPRVPWSDAEITTLKEMYEAEMTLTQISQRLHRSIASISSKAIELGMAQKIVKWNNPKFKAIYQDYDWCYERFINRGMDMHDMAKEANCTLRVMQNGVPKNII